MGGYSTREVSDLIGLKPGQVRHCVRRALVEPERGRRGEFRFGFQDVVLLRTAKGLLDAQVSPRLAFRALSKLRSDLSSVRSLTAMRIYADGADVLVREEDRIWSVESGQGQLNFSIRELADNVSNLAGSNFDVAKATDQFNSDEWYNLGLDLEEVDPVRAPEAYRKAIESNPRNADGHVNLGRLCQLRGDLKNAKRHYELALAAVTSHQLAHYNLGTVFDELEEIERAIAFYSRAPAVPDAHYNLARLAELNGDEVAARRHMRAYRQLLESEG